MPHPAGQTASPTGTGEPVLPAAQRYVDAVTSLEPSRQRLRVHWAPAGSYELTLTRDETAGWLIAGITLRTLYQDGDRNLVEAASARAQSH